MLFRKIPLESFTTASASDHISSENPVIRKACYLEKDYFEILLKKKIGYSRSFPGKPGLFQIMNMGHPFKQHDFPELVKDGRRWGKNLMAYAGKQ